MEADTTRVARARFAISAETFALLSYVALAALFLIVVSGATVRLTGSGLGCDNWPRSSSTAIGESASSSASSLLWPRSARPVSSGFRAGFSGPRGHSP
jgi:heme A synthase